MSCLYPRLAFYDTRTQKARVFFKPPVNSWYFRLPDGVEEIRLPCGKCFGCIKSRALDITVRAVAESRMHDFSSFITLTVSDDRLAEVFPHGLEHRPFQLFAKRLRKKIGRFSYLMCGEYGSRTMRPHYHCVIFGHRFVDGSFDESGDGLWIPSRVLHEAWSYGHVTVDDVNNNRMAYVAGYTCKDFALGRTKDFYRSRGLGLPYVRWSRRPALGLRWFEAFKDDLIDDDYNFEFVLDSKPFKFSSRYFFSRLKLTEPEYCDTMSRVRRDRIRDVDDLTVIIRHDNLKRACEVKQYNLKKKAVDSAI